MNCAVCCARRARSDRPFCCAKSLAHLGACKASARLLFSRSSKSRRGEIGRRARLKILFPKGSVGSTPSAGTASANCWTRISHSPPLFLLIFLCHGWWKIKRKRKRKKTLCPRFPQECEKSGLDIGNRMKIPSGSSYQIDARQPMPFVAALRCVKAANAPLPELTPAFTDTVSVNPTRK